MSLQVIAVAFAAATAPAPEAAAQTLVPVRGFVSEPAPQWPVASLKFVGTRLALGINESHPAGVVRFLEPASTGWQFGGTTIAAPDPDCRDFGLSLAVDGTRLAVGSSTGHVFVFDTASAVPSLIASWRASPAGHTLVHSLSGDTLLVGLPASNAGQGGGALLRIQGSRMDVVRTLVPERPAGGLGWSGGISGDSIVLSAESNASNWHAMTWRRDASGQWAFETELSPANPAGNPIFGCSSSIEGGVIAVGARDDGAAGFQSGACYVFERIGNAWVQTGKLALTDPPFANQETGGSVEVRGGRVWFSAGGNIENGIGDRGRLLVADKISATWQVTQTLRSADSGYPTFWGSGATFGPWGSVAAFGFDSPLPFSSWRFRFDVFAPSGDCDQDGTQDLWQIWTGASSDANADGVPDVCQPPTCFSADLVRDADVNGADLGILLSQWGSNGAATGSDINQDGVVNGADLATLISFWGPCP